MNRFLAAGIAGFVSLTAVSFAAAQADATTASDSGYVATTPTTYVATSTTCVQLPWNLTIPRPAQWTAEVTSAGTSMRGSARGSASVTASAHAFTYCPAYDGFGTKVLESAIRASWNVGPRHTMTEALTLSTNTTLLAGSRLAMAATDRPVVGGSVSVSGSLQVLNPTAGFQTAQGRTVAIEWRNGGTTTWSCVATPRTDAKGGFTFTTKAVRDGAFRVVYAGASTVAGATSLSDIVDVR